MIEFIKENGEIFSIARDVKSAFYMYKTAKDLNHSIRINGINYGNDWQARYEIEKFFNTSYKIPNTLQ